mgnify:CR=1 FL=1
MSCKRGQSSLLGLPSAADIMKRATCFMRGNAPCGVKGVMGYALSARGIFAQRKNAECINRGLRFPRALPWAMGNIWAYSPPQSFTGRLCKLVRFQQTFAAPWERTEICFLARALRIIFPEKPFNPALIHIAACNQTGCECMVCTSNPSLMKGLSCPEIDLYICNVCAFQAKTFIYMHLFLAFSATLGIARTSS